MDRLITLVIIILIVLCILNISIIKIQIDRHNNKMDTIQKQFLETLTGKEDKTK